MTVFHYSEEEGIITIVKDNFVAKDINVSKPAFITGEKFIYDIIQKEKTVNGLVLELTAEDIAAMEKYIADYVEIANAAIKAAPERHFVNKYGRYIGTVSTSETDQEVESMPIDTALYFYSEGKWVLGYSVDIVSGKLVQDGVKCADDVCYIDRALVNMEACTACQSYDFVTKQVVIDLVLAKNTKNAKMSAAMQAEVADATSSLGGFGYYEVASFPFQVAEAKAFKLDPTAQTEFIDELLVSRGFEGETKEILANKILDKYSVWRKVYTTALGKYHRKVKELESATTLEQVVAVSW